MSSAGGSLSLHADSIASLMSKAERPMRMFDTSVSREQAQSAYSPRMCLPSMSSRSTMLDSDFDHPTRDSNASVTTASDDDEPIYYCEFIDFHECDEHYARHERNEWIDHMINDHLQHRFPRYSLCWYCDEDLIAFEAASTHQADLEATYRERMLHIAGHLLEGKSVVHKRADYFFLDHLVDERLVNESVRQIALEWHGREVPAPRGVTLSRILPREEAETSTISVAESSRYRRNGSRRAPRVEMYYS